MRNKSDKWIAAMAVSVVLAACGGDGDAATTTNGGLEATTTVTSADDTTSSTGESTTSSPATTTTMIETTSTTVTTTTVATTTTAGATTTQPTLDLGSFVVTSGMCSLGWWGAGWQSGAALPVSGGEQYQVVRLDEPITIASGSAPTTTCEPLDLPTVPLEPEPPGGFLELDAVAIQTGGDVRPHLVALGDPGDPTYVDITAGLLESRGVADPDVIIEQVIRTDLEGDGVEEVIVAASSIDPADFLAAEVGDYSLVYLRRLVAGEVQTAILRDVIVLSPDDVPQNLGRYRVSAVADLNGDGKMEIILSSETWEGATVEAWEYVNDDLGPVEILGCGCGS